MPSDENVPAKGCYYAPGYYTSYGVKTIPAVREAIEQRRWTEVIEQEKLTALVLETYATHLEDLAAYIQSP